MKKLNIFKFKIATDIGMIGCLIYWIAYYKTLGLNKWIGIILLILQIFVIYLDIKDYKIYRK